jgi:hypothetical protein
MLLRFPEELVTMRFFQPEVETVLKVVGAAMLIGAVVLPTAWAYEQRQQARAWQSVACTYRMRELTRRAPLVATVEYGRDPCLTRERLGVELDVQRVSAAR